MLQISKQAQRKVAAPFIQKCLLRREATTGVEIVLYTHLEALKNSVENLDSGQESFVTYRIDFHNTIRQTRSAKIYDQKEREIIFEEHTATHKCKNSVKDIVEPTALT